MCRPKLHDRGSQRLPGSWIEKIRGNLLKSYGQARVTLCIHGELDQLAFSWAIVFVCFCWTFSKVAGVICQLESHWNHQKSVSRSPLLWGLWTTQLLWQQPHVIAVASRTMHHLPLFWGTVKAMLQGFYHGKMAITRSIHTHVYIYILYYTHIYIYIRVCVCLFIYLSIY